jgi:hypothetical protein
MPKSRKSLSIRLQPYEGTPMAEVADYLNDLDSGSALRKVEDLLVLGLLAYARLEQDTDAERLRLTAIECCDALEKHAATIRLAIGVEPVNRQEQLATQKRGLDVVNLATTPMDEPRPTAPSISKQIGNVFGDDD